MFNDLSGEIIVRFVDIGGNFDHHCLNTDDHGYVPLS
jgi:hypothetical protein